MDYGLYSSAVAQMSHGWNEEEIKRFLNTWADDDIKEQLKGKNE